MINIDNISKSHRLGDGRRHWVFKNTSLQIPKQQNVAILGVNGAGKSTLLRMLGGIDLPDRGRITVNGRISPPLGLQSGLSRNLSGRENAKFACRIQGDRGAALKQRVDQIEAFAELGKFFDEPIRSYSSGMRARLSFACSVVFHYDYLLVDELVSVGDQSFRQKASDTFAAMRGQSTLILVSHNFRLLQRHCDSAIYVRQGRLDYFSDVNEAVNAFKQDNIKGAEPNPPKYPAT